jgi:RNAse (barnase) inhibitor barstar
MAHRLIRTADDLDALSTLLGNLKLPITVEWVQGLDRSAQQNKLMWLWAGEVEHQAQQETADEVQRRWKLEIGVPILRRDSDEFRQLYDEAIRPLPYEMKLKAMRLVPVTSEFKVTQMVEFMDTVQRECAEQGIKLTDPDPELAAYQSRYRSNERKAA